MHAHTYLLDSLLKVHYNSPMQKGALATREDYKPIPIREGHPLRIPERTMTRSRQYRTAALLYIYGDLETGEMDMSIKEISESTGCSEQRVSVIAKDDRWEEFRLDRIAELIEDDGIAPLQLMRTSEELKRITEEHERQVLEIPVLVKEAGRVLDEMKITTVSEKKYASMVGTLDKLTKMLETRSGKENFDKQQDEIRKAQIRIEERKADKPPGQPNDAKIIEIKPA